jgi:2-(1,2-epoxy-1,2-dihydrophenyl)acetyl-CoA isomerase
MYAPDVLVDRDGSVGLITINRPTRLNAVTPAMANTLRSAFLEMEGDSSIRAVVLTMPAGCYRKRGIP